MGIKINYIIKNKLPYTNRKIGKFFTFKDRIPSLLWCGIVNKFQCGGCNGTYYVETKGDFKVSMRDTW